MDIQTLWFDKSELISYFNIEGQLKNDIIVLAIGDGELDKQKLMVVPDFYVDIGGNAISIRDETTKLLMPSEDIINTYIKRVEKDGDGQKMNFIYICRKIEDVMSLAIVSSFCPLRKLYGDEIIYFERRWYGYNYPSIFSINKE